MKFEPGTTLKKTLIACMCMFMPHMLMAQLDTLWYGHRAFGEGRYDDAIDAYQAAIDEGSDQDWFSDLIETVRIRKDLGEIAPADTHRIMVIFVIQLNEISGADTLTTDDVTSSQKENWRIYFDVFKQTIESFSGGNWTIQIDSVDAVSTYRSGSVLKPDNPDHLNSGDDFFDTMAAYDSYITFSNTRSPGMGLARQYPYINGILYGPHRGMAAINAGTHGYGILLHEFFHIIEWISNAISPAHGFEVDVRNNFPGWTGDTEFDYYRWHFAKTLPEVGWRKLNHRTRWIPFERNSRNFDLISSTYEDIPLDDRERADTLFGEGLALKGTDLSRAAAKWEGAVELSPYHEKALVELHDYYEYSLGNRSRADEIYDRLHMIRTVADFYTIDPVNESYGEVIGMWHREDISAEWEFVSWDVSGYFTQSGCYAVSFYHTGGFKALDIDSVSLVEDGNVIALDVHQGFSGNNKTGITYQLKIPDFKPTSGYILKARIKGDGGVDSYGQVQALFTSGSCALSEAPTGLKAGDLQPEISIYPNPAGSFFTVENAAGRHLYIQDVLGRICYERFIDDDRINVNVLRKRGLYFLRLTANGKRPFIRRLVIR